MLKTFFRSTAFFTLLAFAAPAYAQQAQRYEELPNFKQVSERLYRGGQPKRGGFDRLSKMGIKAVINLRAADARARADEARARAAGLHYFNVPMPVHARPANHQIERVLSIINNPEHNSVFIYCRRGADRTGTVIAVYRIENDGWTIDRAQEEANEGGMFFTQLEMKDFIKSYYCRRNHGQCEENSFMERVGLAAATGTRLMVREVSSHSITRGIRGFLR